MMEYFWRVTLKNRMGKEMTNNTMNNLNKINKKLGHTFRFALSCLFFLSLNGHVDAATQSKESLENGQTKTMSDSKGGASQGKIKTINLTIGDAEIIKFGTDATEVFIADPVVADIQLSDPRRLYLFGKALGTTNLFVMGKNNQEILKARVIVSHNLSQLKELIAVYDPHELVEIKSFPGGLILEGVVDSPKTAEAIRMLAEKFIEKEKAHAVVNHLDVKAPVQVQLRVRVAEIERTVVNRLGFNWQSFFKGGDGKFNLGALVGRIPFMTPGTPPGTETVASLIQPVTPRGLDFIDTLGASFTDKHYNINAALDALEKEGLVTILAEPNLVAVSGETASFLAGGEFPYPIPQQLGTTTIEFKQFGVSLAFTPTVLSGNMISMRLRPEVSELDDTQSITINGTSVPGILTRRAETTIQLGSGQTFAIAGLLQNRVSTNIAGLPGLGNLPILGALFRSNAFQRNETELVIVVTAILVEPVSGKELALPTDGLNYATFVEQIFERRLTKPGVQKGEAPAFGPGGARLVGPAGFSLE